MQNQTKTSLRWLIILLCLYTICVFLIDSPIAQLLSKHQASALLGLAKGISFIFKPKLWSALGFLLLLVVCVGLYTKRIQSASKKYFASWVLFFDVTFVITTILKILLGRARPYLAIQDHIRGFFPLMNQYDYFSSPSGHMMVVTAFACLVFGYTRHKLARIAAIICVLAIMAARIILLKHYLGDCILSIGVTLLIYPYHQYMFAKLQQFFNWLHTQIESMI